MAWGSAASLRLFQPGVMDTEATPYVPKLVGPARVHVLLPAHLLNQEPHLAQQDARLPGIERLSTPFEALDYLVQQHSLGD